MHSLSRGIKVFAGQRAEQFYVDLGSIFDLGNLRPLQQLNVFAKAEGLKSAPGVNATDRLNVHSIAIQVPISQLTSSGHPTIGVWTTASRQRGRVSASDESTGTFASGPFTQVSRLGNPLFNEVIVPLGKKDYWNRQQPAHDKQFAEVRTRTRNWPGCCPSSTRARSPIWPRWTRPGRRAPTWRRSCSPASRPA